MNWIKEYLKEEGIPPQVRRTYEAIQDDVNEEKSAHIINFIEKYCKHSKGEFFGRPFKLELFQKAFLSALFGVLESDGRRRYREAFFLVGRKNGKSTLMAAIALYSLLTEKGAEVYTAATKRDQAAIIFNEALHTIQQSRELSRLLRKRKSDIYYERGMGILKPLSKNANSLDGLNANTILLDEAHALESREIYEVLKQSQSARSEPLFITITTAGNVREALYDDLYEIAKNPPRDFLAVLYEGADYLEESTWNLSNPGLGTIKRVDDLRARVERAKKNPVEIPALLCKDFNVLQNVSRAWLTWEELNNEEKFNIEDFRKNHYGIGGVDLSKTTDLTAACILYKLNGKFYVHEHFWLPEASFEAHCKEKIPYQKWLDRGYLSLCSGNVINPLDVADWFDGFVVPWVYYDAWGAQSFTAEMERRGYKITPVWQGARSLSIPMERLKADLTGKLINYDNNPILKWCLSNADCKEDRNGNLMLQKRRNHKLRIDGVAALLDCYFGLGEREENLR